MQKPIHVLLIMALALIGLGFKMPTIHLGEKDYTISGKITNENGSPMAGVEVYLEGPETAIHTMTDAYGNYKFNHLASQNDYFVKPSAVIKSKASYGLKDLINTNLYLYGMQDFKNTSEFLRSDVDHSDLVDYVDVSLIRDQILERKTYSDIHVKFIRSGDEVLDNNSLDIVSRPYSIKGINESIKGLNYVAIYPDITTKDLATCSLQLQYNDQEIKKGETTILKITAKNYYNLMGSSFGLKLDYSKVKTGKISSPSFNESHYFHKKSYINDAQFIQFLEYGIKSKTFNENTIIYEIEIEALADIRLSDVVRISSEFNESYSSTGKKYDVELIPIKIIEAENTSKLEATLFQNYPNPFLSETRVRFELAQQQQVEFQLVDARGKKIWSRVMIYPEGEHTIEFNGEHFTSGEGLYKLFMITPNKISEKSLFCMK